jgi:hypothetical protein
MYIFKAVDLDRGFRKSVAATSFVQSSAVHWYKHMYILISMHPFIMSTAAAAELNFKVASHESTNIPL